MFTSYTTIDSYIDAVSTLADAPVAIENSYSAALSTYFKTHALPEPAKTLVMSLIAVLRWRYQTIQFFEQNILPANGFFRSYNDIYTEVYTTFNNESIFYRETLSNTMDVEKSKEFVDDQQLQLTLSAMLKSLPYTDIKPYIWKSITDCKSLMKSYGESFVQLYPGYFVKPSEDLLEQLGKLISTVNYVMGPLTMRAIENIRSDRKVELTVAEKQVSVSVSKDTIAARLQELFCKEPSSVSNVVEARLEAAAAAVASSVPQDSPVPPASCVSTADIQRCKKLAENLEAQVQAKKVYGRPSAPSRPSARPRPSGPSAPPPQTGKTKLQLLREQMDKDFLARQR